MGFWRIAYIAGELKSLGGSADRVPPVTQPRPPVRPPGAYSAQRGSEYAAFRRRWGCLRALCAKGPRLTKVGGGLCKSKSLQSPADLGTVPVSHYVSLPLGPEGGYRKRAIFGQKNGFFAKRLRR